MAVMKGVIMKESGMSARKYENLGGMKSWRRHRG